MISIVCVYNNKQIMHDHLIKSLEKQSTNYELITLDNTNNKYTSAAQALNEGAKNATGNYIMFTHQDINMATNSWLVDVENMINSLPNLGIAGVAGNRDKDVVTNLKHGIPPKFAGELTIDIPTKVQTLDECLVIIPKTFFDILKFDEKTCTNWHLYVVDYCLSAHNIGYDAYVLPIDTFHLSEGNAKSVKYVITISKILKKHKYQHKQIYTACGIKVWDTKYPAILQILRYKINRLYR